MSATSVSTDLIAELGALEALLQSSGTRSDRGALESLLAPEFMEFGASGVVWTRQAVMDALSEMVLDKLCMEDVQIRLLAEGVGLLTYRAMRDGGPTRCAATSLRSSIWRKSGRRWQLIFHQGSPWMPMEVAHVLG